MLAVLAALLASASAYTLLRGPKAPDPVPGFAVLPVPVSKIIAPGQQATLHIYDASSLQALPSATFVFTRKEDYKAIQAGCLSRSMPCRAVPCCALQQHCISWYICQAREMKACRSDAQAEQSAAMGYTSRRLYI